MVGIRFSGPLSCRPPACLSMPAPADPLDEIVEIGHLQAQTFGIELGARHVVENLATADEFFAGRDQVGV